MSSETPAAAPSFAKALFWMTCSIACFLVMSVGGRSVTRALDVFQVLEVRSILGWVMLLPLVWASGGFPAMRTRRPLLHLGRNVAHYAGQYAWFYALTLIPLAQLISIEFTMPFWTAILAVIVLGERMTGARIAAVVLGIVGVAIVVRPGVAPLETGHLVMLAGAVCFALSIVMVKAMTQTENVVRIIFWMLVLQSIFGLIPAILVWRPLPLDYWPAMIVVAFTGTFSHYCLARALSHADATTIMPVDFLRVPISALIGWALYSERIDIYTALGAALILAGNLLNLPRRKNATVSRP